MVIRNNTAEVSAPQTSLTDRTEKVVDRTYQGQSLMRLAAFILRDNAHNQNGNPSLTPQEISDIANLCDLAGEFLSECGDLLEEGGRIGALGGRAV